MGQRQVQRLDVGGAYELVRRAVQHHVRGAGFVAHHLDAAPRRRTDAGTDALQHRLLGREARGQPLRSGAGVATLALGEQPLDETGTALEDPSEARHVHQVHADAEGRHYSTVTVLARLRGRSTFRPRPRAMA